MTIANLAPSYIDSSHLADTVESQVLCVKSIRAGNFKIQKYWAIKRKSCSTTVLWATFPVKSYPISPG
jgi:hypothetical protein